MALIHLHGLVPSGTELVATDPPHTALACGEMLALVSEMPDAGMFETMPPEALADWALGHNSILMAYCASAAVLPMRPGAVFSGAAALIREVTARADHYRSCLAALADLREYTVQLLVVAGRAGSEAEPTSGRAHLKARLADRRAREVQAAERTKLAQDILRYINALALQVEPAGAPKQGRLLDCVTLLRRSDVPELRTFVQRNHHAAAGLGLDLVVAGPWPAYSYDIAADPAFGRRDVS